MNSTQAYETSSLVLDALQKRCKTPVPKHLHEAWSSPFGLLFVAEAAVVVTAAYPLLKVLIASSFHHLRKLLRDKLAKAGAPEVVEDEVEKQIHAKTKDIEEGIHQEMVSFANVAIEGLDLGGGDGEDEKKDTKGKGRVEEPDKAS
ncbi:hypothetical protein TrRE_jg4884, partial [Triparma retinervis]